MWLVRNAKANSVYDFVAVAGYASVFVLKLVIVNVRCPVLAYKIQYIRSLFTCTLELILLLLQGALFIIHVVQLLTEMIENTRF